MNRLTAELTRVFGDPPVAPRAVVRVQVGDGQGLQAERDEADRFVDAGADLVVLDSEATSPATLTAVAALLVLEPVTVVDGRHSPDWADRLVQVRALLREVRGRSGDPEELLTALGDQALGRLVGLLERLAKRRTPVLLGGGTGTAAAALLAQRLRPGAERWWLAGSQPTDEAGRRALAATGLTPLLDLGLTTGSADVAVAVVRTGLEQLGA